MYSMSAPSHPTQFYVGVSGTYIGPGSVGPSSAMRCGSSHLSLTAVRVVRRTWSSALKGDSRAVFILSPSKEHRKYSFGKSYPDI